MTAEHAARGRKNDRAGKTWLRAAAAWCRANGAPDADAVTRAYASDLTGLNVPLAVEATIEPWDSTGHKADQAARDAERRGIPYWCVWKPRRADPGGPRRDPGEGWCITEFRQMWQLVREIAELRTQVRVLQETLDARPARKRNPT